MRANYLTLMTVAWLLAAAGAVRANADECEAVCTAYSDCATACWDAQRNVPSTCGQYGYCEQCVPDFRPIETVQIGRRAITYSTIWEECYYKDYYRTTYHDFRGCLPDYHQCERLNGTHVTPRISLGECLHTRVLDWGTTC
jgi:hypothetical protein